MDFKDTITRDDPDYETKHIHFLRRIPREMKRICDAAAEEERKTHAYQNRTHNLEDHTIAHDIVESVGMASVRIEMGEEYASYVVARGLSNWETVIDKASFAIADMIASGPKE